MSTFLSNLRHQLVEESSVIIPGSYVDQQSVVFSTYSQTVGQQTQNVIVDLSNNYINRNIYTTDTPHTIWYFSRHETRSYITNVNHLLNTSHLNNDDFYPRYQKREIPLYFQPDPGFHYPENYYKLTNTFIHQIIPNNSQDLWFIVESSNKFILQHRDLFDTNLIYGNVSLDNNYQSTLYINRPSSGPVMDPVYTMIDQSFQPTLVTNQQKELSCYHLLLQKITTNDADPEYDLWKISENDLSNNLLNTTTLTTPLTSIKLPSPTLIIIDYCILEDSSVVVLTNTIETPTIMYLFKYRIDLFNNQQTSTQQKLPYLSYLDPIFSYQFITNNKKFSNFRIFIMKRQIYTPYDTELFDPNIYLYGTDTLDIVHPDLSVTSITEEFIIQLCFQIDMNNMMALGFDPDSKKLVCRIYVHSTTNKYYHLQQTQLQDSIHQFDNDTTDFRLTGYQEWTNNSLSNPYTYRRYLLYGEIEDNSWSIIMTINYDNDGKPVSLKKLLDYGNYSNNNNNGVYNWLSHIPVKNQLSFQGSVLDKNGKCYQIALDNNINTSTYLTRMIGQGEVHQKIKSTKLIVGQYDPYFNQGQSYSQEINITNLLILDLLFTNEDRYPVSYLIVVGNKRDENNDSKGIINIYNTQVTIPESDLKSTITTSGFITSSFVYRVDDTYSNLYVTGEQNKKLWLAKYIIRHEISNKVVIEPIKENSIETWNKLFNVSVFREKAEVLTYQLSTSNQINRIMIVGVIAYSNRNEIFLLSATTDGLLDKSFSYNGIVSPYWSQEAISDPTLSGIKVRDVMITPNGIQVFGYCGKGLMSDELYNNLGSLHPLDRDLYSPAIFQITSSGLIDRSTFGEFSIGLVREKITVTEDNNLILWNISNNYNILPGDYTPEQIIREFQKSIEGYTSIDIIANGNELIFSDNTARGELIFKSDLLPYFGAATNTIRFQNNVDYRCAYSIIMNDRSSFRIQSLDGSPLTELYQVIVGEHHCFESNKFNNTVDYKIKPYLQLVDASGVLLEPFLQLVDASGVLLEPFLQNSIIEDINNSNIQNTFVRILNVRVLVSNHNPGLKTCVLVGQSSSNKTFSNDTTKTWIRFYNINFSNEKVIFSTSDHNLLQDGFLRWPENDQQIFLNHKYSLLNLDRIGKLWLMKDNKINRYIGLDQYITPQYIHKEDVTPLDVNLIISNDVLSRAAVSLKSYDQIVPSVSYQSIQPQRRRLLVNDESVNLREVINQINDDYISFQLETNVLIGDTVIPDIQSVSEPTYYSIFNNVIPKKNDFIINDIRNSLPDLSGNYSKVLSWKSGEVFNIALNIASFKTSDQYGCIFIDGKLNTGRRGGNVLDGQVIDTALSDSLTTYTPSNPEPWQNYSNVFKSDIDSILKTTSNIDSDWNRQHRFDLGICHKFNTDTRHIFKIKTHLEPVLFQRNIDKSENVISFFQLKVDPSNNLQLDVETSGLPWTVDVSSSNNDTLSLESAVNFLKYPLNDYGIAVGDYTFRATAIRDGNILTSTWILYNWSTRLGDFQPELDTQNELLISVTNIQYLPNRSKLVFYVQLAPIIGGVTCWYLSVGGILKNNTSVSPNRVELVDLSGIVQTSLDVTDSPDRSIVSVLNTREYQIYRISFQQLDFSSENVCSVLLPTDNEWRSQPQDYYLYPADDRKLLIDTTETSKCTITTPLLQTEISVDHYHAYRDLSSNIKSFRTDILLTSKGEYDRIEYDILHYTGLTYSREDFYKWITNSTNDGTVNHPAETWTQVGDVHDLPEISNSQFTSLSNPNVVIPENEEIDDTVGTLAFNWNVKNIEYLNLPPYTNIRHNDRTKDQIENNNDDPDFDDWKWYRVLIKGYKLLRLEWNVNGNTQPDIIYSSNDPIFSRSISEFAKHLENRLNSVNDQSNSYSTTDLSGSYISVSENTNNGLTLNLSGNAQVDILRTSSLLSVMGFGVQLLSYYVGLDVVDNTRGVIEGQDIYFSNNSIILQKDNPVTSEYPVNLDFPKKLQITETHQDILLSVIRRPPKMTN